LTFILNQSTELRMNIRQSLAGIGVLGFLFFLVKGLLWLAVPAILVALNRQ